MYCMTMKWCSVSSLHSHQEQCTCRPQTVQDGSYCIVERSSYLDLHWGREGEGEGEGEREGGMGGEYTPACAFPLICQS